ncbi:hypothetical protein Fmac_009507 [Flemingia macrophylla]|uniref:Uncharacterized protein n=1 Tax=Flemingia macrophylla TaxID=520843 RepID=A0ABD1N1D1_9FABA
MKCRHVIEAHVSVPAGNRAPVPGCDELESNAKTDIQEGRIAARKLLSSYGGAFSSVTHRAILFCFSTAAAAAAALPSSPL